MMKYDGKINIATGLSAGSRKWKNKELNWSELVQRLSEDRKTSETFKEYMAATKAEQLKIKDVGGYVGGYLSNGKRGINNVGFRRVITLDIDFAHNDFWEDFILTFDNAAVLHSTHKHHVDSPRLRLIMPINREVSADEYVAISRKIAGDLNIELFDNTTFEPNRLMFWPSTPKDIDYYFKTQDGPWIDADEVLNSYIDWKDSSLWPTADKQLDRIRGAAEKQQDPTAKKGIIGAFCRTYTMTEAIETFLAEEYTPVDGDDSRWTYKKGSTAAGLIIYDDKFAYSHHGTDPAGGKLSNAFDLVRLHKFGHLDEQSKDNQKSFKAMEEFAREDKEVRKVIASEKLDSAKYDFAEDLTEIEMQEDASDWMSEMEVDGKGRYLSTAVNLNLIFANDIRFKGLFKMNEFDMKRYVCGNMPWRKIDKPEPVKNVDYSGVRNYIESIYGISGTIKIDDAMALEFERQSFHPVRDYLKGLKWDGKQRIDFILIDYFGVEDNIYTREAMRKCMVGAVGRIFKPGIKFDHVLTLVGDQGSGKSTLIKKLGKEWYSDTFMTVHGKEALEQIQGAWLIEMAELSGLRKAEVEPIKHFLSKQEDTFRPAYARISETFKRQCVFIGTTNNRDFLRDPSGNRRFIPVDVDSSRATSDIFEDMTEAEVDQMWAEAVQLFKKGEKLFLGPEAERIAKREQRDHSEGDERFGIIEDYLETPLPDNWRTRDLHHRRLYLNGDELEEKGTNIRDVVCVAEIWCECLGKAKEDMSRYTTRDINDVMRQMDGWKASKSTKKFKLYGIQKYYERIKKKS